MATLAGQTVSHYRILEHLGGGGMGVVYKAQDLKLDRPVALKFLPTDLTRDAEAKQRFVQEAKAASALQHSNICVVHDIDETPDGQLFIVMEFYDGETLKKRLDRGKIGAPEAVGIALQVAQGLAKAHDHGLIHRDIKPANIMVTADGVAKVVDFGLAKLTGSARLTRTGSTIGTVAYMPPEQAKGEATDERADAWSLGVVLFEMLCGQLPFRGDHEAALLYAIVNEEPAPIQRLLPRLPQALADILAKCLQKEPAARYRTARDLAGDLQRLRLKPYGPKAPAGPLSARVSSRRRRLMSRPLWLAVAGLLGIILVTLFLWPERHAPVGADRSIAVLPFTNLSDSKEDEYFADGLTEDVITQLYKVRSLQKVIARTSVMQYKNTTLRVRDIGEALHVSTVLEGSVRREGERVRVAAQLINVQDESHLWAETYDRDLKNIFSIQSEIARHIATALEATLGIEERRMIDKVETGSNEAYEQFLRGRFFLNKRTQADLHRAVACFSEAIRLDSSYARAYASLAFTYSAFASYSRIPTVELYQKAEWAIHRAMALDPSLPEVHVTLGNIRAGYDWDWKGAEPEYRTAIALNPNGASERNSYYNFLANLGRFEEASTEIHRARELDPLAVGINFNLGELSYRMGRFDETEAQLKRTLEIEPCNESCHFLLALVYEMTSRYDLALQANFKARECSGDSSLALDNLIRLYAKTGRMSEARSSLRELEAFAAKGYSVSVMAASGYWALGDTTRAFQWLERAYRERDGELIYANTMPHVPGELRTHPRFVELMKKVGTRQ